MLHHLFLNIQPYAHFLRVMQYVSFRSMAALITALLLSFAFGGWFIERSKRFFRSSVRAFTPEAHQLKHNTPTMGGLLMLGVVIITILLWSNLLDPKIVVVLATLVFFGMIGLWDDLSKIRFKKGISERQKWCAQLVASALVLCLWYWLEAPSTKICFPFLKDLQPDIGFWYYFWALFILVAASNAVNLTDGLDGLAIGALLPNFATFSLIAYCAGHVIFAHYLQIPFAASAELVIVGVALIGASLGFLWYNSYPAQIFMGDVGALSLGAVLGLMALMTKQEVLLALSGGVFVGETLSVIIQVVGYKLFGIRVFKIAPIHHHFERLGWPETKITIRASIITIILCLISLMTLKLR